MWLIIWFGKFIHGLRLEKYQYVVCVMRASFFCFFFWKIFFKFHSKVEFLLSVFTFDCVQLHFWKPQQKRLSLHTKPPCKQSGKQLNKQLYKIYKLKYRQERNCHCTPNTLKYRNSNAKSQKKISESKQATKIALCSSAFCLPFIISDQIPPLISANVFHFIFLLDSVSPTNTVSAFFSKSVSIIRYGKVHGIDLIKSH